MITESRRVTRPVLRLTPADHGRRISLYDFEHAETEEGACYEIIDGSVYVSPRADIPHEMLENWLYTELADYSRAHEKIVQRVSFSARVFVPDRERETCPEPDIAVYRKFPRRFKSWMVDWRLISPVIVVEIRSQSDRDKDLERNVELYLQVPSIREYWIVDQSTPLDLPSLIVHRRRGSRWQKPIQVPPHGTYATPLLPGFELKLDASDA